MAANDKRACNKHTQVWSVVEKAAFAKTIGDDDDWRGLLPYVHPARLWDFDTLYSALTKEVQEGNVFKRTAAYQKISCDSSSDSASDGDASSLELFVYTPKCESLSAWSEACMLSRGLVVDAKEKKVVATPFYKFFNDFEDTASLGKALGRVGERSKMTDREGCGVRVTEKMDGSLGIVFYAAGRWRVCTKGSFSSPQAEWGARHLHSNYDLEKLVKGTTYLGELIYPENRIVIPYSEEYTGITWLAAYAGCGREYTLDRLKTELESAILPTGPSGEPQILRLTDQLHFKSLSDLKDCVENLPWTSEGYVVLVEELGFRSKLKGPAYVQAHKNRDRVTPAGLWNLLRVVLFTNEGTAAKQNFFKMERVEESLDEEILADYYALKARVVDEYSKQLLWMEALRRGLESLERADVPRKELARIQKELQSITGERMKMEDALEYGEPDGEAAPCAKFLLREVGKAWRDLWDGSCEQDGDEILTPFYCYPTTVRKAVIETTGRSWLDIEDKDVKARVQELLKQSRTDDVPGPNVLNADLPVPFLVKVFFDAVGKRAPQAGEDPLLWLRLKERLKLYDRLKPESTGRGA